MGYKLDISVVCFFQSIFAFPGLLFPTISGLPWANVVFNRLSLL